MENGSLLVCVESGYVTPELLERVKNYSEGRDVICSTDREEILKHADSIEIVLGDLPRDLLLKLPRLQWFQQFGTGVEWLKENPRIAEASFILSNCSDDHFMVVADHMFALILSMSRDIPRFVLSQAKGLWERPSALGDPRYFELRGKTMLVVGLGSIGRELVKRGATFGLRSIGVRRDPSKPMNGVGKIYGTDQLNTAAKEADIVAVCLPDTAETMKLFDSSFFDAMKKDGYFFNVGRGTCVDEGALDHALRNGTIAGAGLDVFEQEPLRSDSPLWTAPNLLITPHVGGYYNRVIETWIEIALDNLHRNFEGRPLRNLVNKLAGY